MMRTLCERGCPYGGYFSSNASTLPWATKTGNLTIHTDSVVHSIIYDEDKNKAAGVRVLDAHTREVREYRVTESFTYFYGHHRPCRQPRSGGIEEGITVMPCPP